MNLLASVQQILSPLFPGLLGIELTEVGPERVIGECTPFHRGRTTMVWQTMVRSEAGKLCAVVTQTQMVLPASADAQR